VKIIIDYVKLREIVNRKKGAIGEKIIRACLAKIGPFRSATVSTVKRVFSPF